MTRRPNFRLLLLIAVTAAAACTGAPGGPGASGGGASGGGSAFDACTLLTGNEAGGALHLEELKGSGTPGDPASCGYKMGNGDEALATTVLRDGAENQFKSFVDNGSAETVTGVGDKALWEPSSRRLVFIAGGRFVSVYVRTYSGSGTPLEVTTAIGKVIAARLTGGSVPSGLTATAPPVSKAQNACELLTPAEAANELSLGALKTDGSQSQFCNFSLASGEVVITTYFQRTNGSATWDSLTAGMTTEPVAALGEKAVFEPDTRKLFVLKGDSVFFVQVHSTDYDEDAALSAGEQLAHLMLDNI